jgi:uncharacterized protein (DUF2252 family)
MGIVKTTAEYEVWLRSQTTLADDEIKLKHQKMACGEFPFLRATFYRWAHLFPKHCEELCKAPGILGVGDLHVENFGTWRDAEGRVAWGVNDFDEACLLPYTNDLVRLATSAYFAGSDAARTLSLDFKDACRAIQEGYLKGIEKPRPFVLAEEHKWLRDIVMRGLADSSPGNEDAARDDVFKKFHKKHTTLDEVRGEIPGGARRALNECFPQPAPAYEIKHREAGLGSLGRRRFTAVVSDWQGGIIVREAKELVPSAWLWANQEREESSAAALTAKRIYYREVVGQAVRSADPSLMVFDEWVARRLGPDAFKVEILDLEIKPHAKEELIKKLLEAMGKEIANVHSPSSASRNLVVEHLKAISNNHQSVKWLLEGAMTMVKQTQDDFRDWKQEGHQCPPAKK